MSVSVSYLRVESGVGRERNLVLNDVSAEFPSAQITAVLAHSGLSRRALAGAIATTGSFSNGTVQVAGADLATASSETKTTLLTRRIGIIQEADNLLPGLSIAANLDLPARLNAVSDEEKRAQLISVFGLEDALNRLASEVSALIQIRCAIASLLLSGRDILVCNDPTAGLDDSERENIISLLKVSVREFGASVVLITSDVIAAARADTLYFLSEGKIVAELAAPTLDATLTTYARLQR